jgi:hypothetical protein
MNGNNDWIYWLLAGSIPYNIEKHNIQNGRVFSIRALFWSLEIHSWKGKRYRWMIRVPLIERCRNAIWAAITHFQRDAPPEG